MLAPRQRALHELAADGLLTSAPEVLAKLGFDRAHVCGPGDVPEEMALDAARAALSEAGVLPSDVDVLVWASARPEGHVRSGATRFGGPDFLRSFSYTSAWLQEVLGLHNAEVMAVAQQGCATMFAALRVARSVLLAEPGRRHVLCVGMDALPSEAPREILYNVISDAACAVVLSRGCAAEKWLGFTQISRGYYWDPVASAPEIVASYFPTSKAVIEQLLLAHGLSPADIDVVVPTGVTRSSWDILLRLVGIPLNRLRADLPSFGHTIIADSFVYLEGLRRSGQVARGSRLLLFTFGFGSSWCALLLEH